MNNWIPKNKIIKFAAAAALLGVALYLNGLLVVFREIRKVENLYNDTESEFLKEKKFWAIKSIAEANEETIRTLKDFFIQKNDEVKFIEQVEEIAKNSAIKFEIASIDVKINQKDSFKEDVAVKIKTEGSWESIASFADKMEKMPFGVLINNINLDADAPGHWSGSIGFTVFREK